MVLFGRRKNADKWFREGVKLLDGGKFEEAIKCFDKALEIDPKYADAWYNKGLALAKLGKYEEALKYYDKALEIDPKYAGAWCGKGAALYYLGRYEEALKYCDKALEIDPKNADAWCGKGWALTGLGRYEEALKYYDKALEIVSKFANAWCGKGLALAKLGRYEEAIKCYDKALEIDPKYAGAWYNKGVALVELDRYKEALKCFDKVLEIYPNLDLVKSDKMLAEDLKILVSGLKGIMDKHSYPFEVTRTILEQAEKNIEDKRYREAINLIKQAINFAKKEVEIFNELSRIHNDITSKNLTRSKMYYDDIYDKIIQAVNNGNFEDAEAFMKKLVDIIHAEECIIRFESVRRNFNLILPKDIAESINSFEEGKYDEESLNTIINKLNDITDRLENCKNQLEDIKLKIASEPNVTFPQKILNLIKDVEDKKLTIDEIEAKINEVKTLFEAIVKSEPDVNVEFSNNLKFQVNYWDELPLVVKNDGYGHAFNVSISISGEVSSKIVTLEKIKGLSSINIKMPIKPLSAGKVPLDIKIEYFNKNNRKYNKSIPLIIHVTTETRSVVHYESKSSDEISAGWTIYDPAKQKFIFTPKCEKPIRDWINNHNPFSYWIAVCISNKSEETVTTFELKFETSTTLKVRGVYIEGYDKQLEFIQEKSKEIGKIKYIISVPEQLPISIPKGGSLRLFIDVFSSICGQRYLIEKGVIKTEKSTIRLNDLDFYYSCELQNIINEPEVIKTKEGQKLMENMLRQKFRNYWRDILNIYNKFNELIEAKELRARRYINLMLKLKRISDDMKFRDFYDYLELCIKRIFLHSKSLNKTYDQLIRNPDYEALLSHEDLQKISVCLIDAINIALLGEYKERYINFE